MVSKDVAENGLVLLGCGKMGSAMLSGWLADGLPPDAVWISDPAPSDWLTAQGVHLNANLPERPAIVLIAVKPQMMADALPSLQPMGNGDTLFVSVAAGTSIATYEDILGDRTPIVRAMPNTPAAIGQGITALIGNAQVNDAQLSMAEELLSAVGDTVRLTDENQMDAVTAVSGSGPASEGLPSALAMQLATKTVAGAGALAAQSDEDPGQLRVNVTSPNGTTQAALEVLMDPAEGFPALLPRAVRAAAERSKELSRDG